MPRLLLFLAIVGVAVIVYALFDCIMSRAEEVRSISKPAWVITILLVPLLGAGLWFLFGRPRSGGSPSPRVTDPRHPTAPDDDPQFLRNLETRRRQQAKEAELRRREEELKAQEREKKNDDGASNSDNPDSEDPRQGPGSKTA
ncbi:PLD nuclease N-terminal domain-containing protein [Arthrobacter sp. H5]|uniref:PLD nuclease N-terminal domain-containing protein n=1 Tax=Arthrobacter sp. H5 TaxID=1267973 RepID=UPI000485648D|nr:PLD nuclease N-terminal domain-containing protein [Arthrobacter sp. H5]